MRCRRVRIAVAGALACALVTPVHATDLLDYVIQAVDPTLAPARPLIECLAGGGNAEHCALEAAKKQAAGALPIGPGDDRVQKAAKVFAAARDERWLDVLKIGGEVVAKSVSCAVLPLQGPVKGTACSIIGWVLSKNAAALDKVWQALKGPDWWALVDVLGTGVCGLIPGDGAAGLAKEVLCGTLGAALLEAKKWASTFAKGLASGAEAITDFVFGDDDGPKRMSADQYFAFAWQPWYHYSTASVLRGQGLGPAVEGPGGIYKRCLDYYGPLGGPPLCGSLKQKFTGQVQGFAGALPSAVDGYFVTVAQPAVRAFAMSTYGKPATGGPPPGQELFVQNCAFALRQRIPFPEPDEGRCIQLADQGSKIAKSGKVPALDQALGQMYTKMAKGCFDDVKLQDVQPTMWQIACEDLRPRYQQSIAGEALRMIGAIGRMKNRGCTTPDKEAAKKNGLVIHCTEYAAYSACLGEFHPNGKKYCRMDTLVMPFALSRVDPSGSPGKPVLATEAAARPMPAETARTEPPAGRTPMRLDPGALGALARAAQLPASTEAESLAGGDRNRIRGGRVVAQDMTGFGAGWSGNAQLFWHGAAVGATLDLLVDVPRDGAWIVEIDLTQAPDYGKLAFEVDQHPVATRFDGYAPGVRGPVTVNLGVFAMQQGLRPVSMIIEGRNSASSGWLAGIDRIRLRPAGN